MDGKTCIGCGLVETTGYPRPYCLYKKRYVWASGYCCHWQREKPPRVAP
jgi:hypothetical protein